MAGANRGLLGHDPRLIKLRREGEIDSEAAKPYIYERTTRDIIESLRRQSRPRGRRAGRLRPGGRTSGGRG